MDERDCCRSAHAAPRRVLASTGSRWDKSAAGAACTSVSGLRQPGGNFTTFNQDVPGRVDITIAGGPALRTGPGPDIEGLAPGVEPERRAQPAGREPAADLDHSRLQRSAFSSSSRTGVDQQASWTDLAGLVRARPDTARSCT